jgi:hypothetical protein
MIAMSGFGNISELFLRNPFEFPELRGEAEFAPDLGDLFYHRCRRIRYGGLVDERFCQNVPSTVDRIEEESKRMRNHDRMSQALLNAEVSSESVTERVYYRTPR